MPRSAVYAACVMAGVVTAATIRFNSFTAWGTDAAGYLIAARHWASGVLFAPDPVEAWLPAVQVGVPLGLRTGAVPGTQVAAYPAGLPILLALGELAHRDLGPFVVVPIFAGVLVLATFAIAKEIAPPWCALIAAAMVALSPIVLGFSVTPMSDIPATALFAVALAMSVRPSRLAAAAGGGCIALAVLTRPILAPLGIVPLALLVAASPARRWIRAALFVGFAAVGPALLAWSQAVLYGGALTPGYIQAESFFSRERVATNALVNLRNLSAVYSPALFIGGLAVLPLYYASRRRDHRHLRIIAALLAVAVINYAVYLPYLTYDDIGYTRFLLPAQVALFILLAASIGYATSLAAGWRKALTAVLVAASLIVVASGAAFWPLLTHAYAGQAQVRVMGHYLRSVLPSNAAVITFLHSGGVSYYSGASIVRYDLLPPGREAEQFLDRIAARGSRLFFLFDQHNEAMSFKNALKGTRYERIAWPARANFMLPGSSLLWYVEEADRHRPRERVPPLDEVR